jgi:hypothetical protein
MFRTLISVAAAFGLSFLTAGCQTTAGIQSKEDMLVAAGFTLQAADSPARLAALKALPPNKFVRKVQGSTVVYVYGDPIVCKCVYFGTQQAYGTYRAMMFQQNIADEQRMTAFMMQDSTFDFGPWGPGFW